MRKVTKCLIMGSSFFILNQFVKRHHYKQDSYYQMFEKVGDMTIVEYHLCQDKLVFSTGAKHMLLLDQTVYKNFSKHYQEYSFLYYQDWIVILKAIKKLMKEKEYKSEARLLFQDGYYHWCLLHFLGVEDKKHKPRKLVCKITDISKHKATLENLKMKTRHDEMTGLYQKGFFEQEVRQLLEYENKGCFLVLDLDNFKRINDTYGHSVGDQCLIEISQILKCSFRKEDIIGRYGGDEFEVFMKNMTDQKAVMKKATQLMEIIASSNIFKDLKIDVTCSIGAVIIHKSMSYQELFQRADLAMYCSKYQGKNQCHIDVFS